MGNKIEVDCLHAHLNIEQMDHKHGVYICGTQKKKQQQECRNHTKFPFTTERQKFYLVNINFRLYSKITKKKKNV